MRPVLVIGALVLLVLAQSSAGLLAASPENAKDVEKTIIQLENSWVSAIVSKDLATLDRLLAPEFNGTSPNAHTFPREVAISDLKSGMYVVTKMHMDEVSVNVFGDVAVAFTSQEEVSRYGDIDLSGHYHYTNVWVKRNGRWQVVASHGSRFDKPHATSSEVPWGQGQFDLLPH
jgi:ketosteroid isomerase-like protein